MLTVKNQNVRITYRSEGNLWKRKKQGILN